MLQGNDSLISQESFLLISLSYFLNCRVDAGTGKMLKPGVRCALLEEQSFKRKIWMIFEYARTLPLSTQSSSSLDEFPCRLLLNSPSRTGKKMIYELSSLDDLESAPSLASKSNI